MLKSLSGDTKVTLSHCTAVIHCFYSFDSKLKFYLWGHINKAVKLKTKQKSFKSQWVFVFDIWVITQMTWMCEQTKSAPSARVQLPRRRHKSGLDVPVARCDLSGTAAAKRFSESLMTLCQCQKLGCRLSLSLRTDPLIQSHLSASLSSHPTLTLNVCLPDHFSRLSLRQCLPNVLQTWGICKSLPSQLRVHLLLPWCRGKRAQLNRDILHAVCGGQRHLRINLQ